MKTNLKSKLGTIRITKDFLFDTEVILKKITFSNFFPIDITYDTFYHDHEVHLYTGISPHFRELKEGEKIPLYDIIFRVDVDISKFEKGDCDWIITDEFYVPTDATKVKLTIIFKEITE